MQLLGMWSNFQNNYSQTPSVVDLERLTLACFNRKSIQKSIDWTGSFSQKRSKMGIDSEIISPVAIYFSVVMR